MTIEKYSPTIRKEKHLNIQGTDYESKLDSMVNDEGIIKMRLNEEVIIQRVSNQLYKSSYSAFRELYNNSCYHGAINEKSYVKVSIDTFTRKFVIQDFNSKGISEDVFKEILTELGTSSNTDRNQGGKFGLGFNAYPLLSDVVILETSCVNGDSFAVIGKGGMQFQKMPKPNLEETGTKLSMTLKTDIDYYKLITKIVECAKTSGVLTYLELKTDENQIAGFSNGLHKLDTKSYSEIFEDNINNNENLSYLKSSFENDDYEIHLSVAVGKDGHLINNRTKKMFLINSPIIAEIDHDDSRSKYYASKKEGSYNSENTEALNKSFASYQRTRIDEIKFDSVVVNMKNEEIFEARGDREETTKETEAKLRDIIIDLYNQTLKKIKPCHDLQSWYNHEQKHFIASSEEDVVNLLDEDSLKLNKLLNTRVFEYKEKAKKNQNTNQLKYIIENNSKNFFVYKKDNRVKNLLDEHFDHNVVIVNPDKDPFNHFDNESYDAEIRNLFDNTIKILNDFGFVEAKQYLKDNNIKATRSNTGIDKQKLDIAIHSSRTYNDYWSSGVRSSSERVQIGSDAFNDLVSNDRLIQVNNFGFFRELLKMRKSDICITTEKKEIKGLVKTISDFENQFNQKTFKTNHGELNFDAIVRVMLSSDNKKVILNSNYKDEEQFKEQIVAIPYVPKTQLYIASSNSSELFILALLLCQKKSSTVHNDVLKFQDEEILQYYHYKFTELTSQLKLSSRFSAGHFSSVFDYEKFLYKLRDFEMKLTDPLIKKLISQVINYENYDEITKDAIELQDRTEKKKDRINREEKEYL